MDSELPTHRPIVRPNGHPPSGWVDDEGSRVTLKLEFRRAFTMWGPGFYTPRYTSSPRFTLDHGVR
jgi:hypothetical protein